MAKTYYERDVKYVMVQKRSLGELFDAVNNMIDEFNTRDTSKEKTEFAMRVEGGIMREDSLATYTQVVVTSEYIERIGWI